MELPLRRRPVDFELPEFGISALRSRHAPGFVMPFGSHRYHKLCLVEEGRGEIIYAGGAYELGPSTVLRVHPGSSHRFVDSPGDPMTLSVLCFNSSVLRSPKSVRELWEGISRSLPSPTPRKLSNEYDRNECVRLVRSIVVELGQDLPGRAASVHAFSISLLVVLKRTLDRPRAAPNTDAPEGFLSSVARLDQRFTENLRISELAKQAGMSYRSYTEHFRRVKGVTFTQYLTQRRLDFAKRRMLETEDILGSSLEAGFSDLSHFYRVFKRHVGETPQAFISRNVRGNGHDG